MTTITYELKSARLDELFRDLKRRAADLRPALVAIGQQLVDSIEQNFEDEGRPVKWKRLSPVTLQERAKKGYTGKILQREGGLAASIANNVDIEADAVIVGTNKSYAPHMHFGTSQSVTPRQRLWMGANLGLWKKVGDKLETFARPFMMIQQEDAEYAENVLVEHLTNV